jgi:leader peptidase (prepilin peptidase) / N-methyltransferase
MVLAELPSAFLLIVSAIFGLLFGSFTNVVIHRLPLEQSVVFPPSACPKCRTRIAAYDNLPVLSYLWLRGKARCCGAKISPRYPLVELLSGMWALAVTRGVLLELPAQTELWRVALLFACYLAFGLMLLAALFIDLDHMLLPNPLTLGATALGLASIPLRGVSWVSCVAGALGAYCVVRLLFIELYGRVRGHPGMGLGDAKLLMVAGAWFGWPGAVFALLGGSVLGAATAIVILLLKGKLEEPEIVRQEREELAALAASLEGAEREELERELAADPLMAAVVATLAFLFVGEPLVQIYGISNIPWTRSPTALATSRPFSHLLGR